MMNGIIYWPDDNYTADINSLQVVLTYDTERSYRIRCLPWFMPKKYLNKHILDGLHQTLEDNPHRTNEIYQWHRVIDLSPYQDCNPRQELEVLFQRKTESGAFHYLDGIATEAMWEYLYLKHKKLARRVHMDQIDIEAQQEFTNLFERTFDTTFKIILPQQIKKATRQILAGRNRY